MYNVCSALMTRKFFCLGVKISGLFVKVTQNCGCCLLKRYHICLILETVQTESHLHMKTELIKHYGDEILFVQSPNQADVITLKKAKTERNSGP